MSERRDQITAVLLAGGQGTRLRSVVADWQKVVALVAGRPFLFRILDQLVDAGVRHGVICTGYRAQQVADTIGSAYRNLSLKYSCEATPLGTAGALRLALPLIQSQWVLVMNGDSFCEVNLVNLMAATQLPGAIVVCPAASTAGGGGVTFNDAGVITTFVEKGTAIGPGWISAGVYFLNRVVLESIPVGRPVSIEREIFPAWVGRGLRVFCQRGRLLDIGTPEAYNNSQVFFK